MSKRKSPDCPKTARHTREALTYFQSDAYHITRRTEQHRIANEFSPTFNPVESALHEINRTLIDIWGAVRKNRMIPDPDEPDYPSAPAVNPLD